MCNVVITPSYTTPDGNDGYFPRITISTKISRVNGYMSNDIGITWLNSKIKEREKKKNKIRKKIKKTKVTLQTVITNISRIIKDVMINISRIIKDWTYV